MAPYGTSYLYHREYGRGEGRSGNFKSWKSLHMLAFLGAKRFFFWTHRTRETGFAPSCLQNVRNRVPYKDWYPTPSPLPVLALVLRVRYPTRIDTPRRGVPGRPLASYAFRRNGDGFGLRLPRRTGERRYR